jgi:hypothetical protein
MARETPGPGFRSRSGCVSCFFRNLKRKDPARGKCQARDGEMPGCRKLMDGKWGCIWAVAAYTSQSLTLLMKVIVNPDGAAL